MADLAVAGLVTIGVTDLADARMVFPAELAGAVTVGVAPRAVGGMIFPANPASAWGCAPMEVSGGAPVAG